MQCCTFSSAFSPMSPLTKHGLIFAGLLLSPSHILYPLAGVCRTSPSFAESSRSMLASSSFRRRSLPRSASPARTPASSRQTNSSQRCVIAPASPQERSRPLPPRCRAGQCRSISAVLQSVRSQGSLGDSRPGGQSLEELRKGASGRLFGPLYGHAYAVDRREAHLGQAGMEKREFAGSYAVPLELVLKPAGHLEDEAVGTEQDTGCSVLHDLIPDGSLVRRQARGRIPDRAVGLRFLQSVR